MHSADPVELPPSQFSLRAASKGDTIQYTIQDTVYNTRQYTIKHSGMAQVAEEWLALTSVNYMKDIMALNAPMDE